MESFKIDMNLMHPILGPISDRTFTQLCNLKFAETDQLFGLFKASYNGDAEWRGIRCGISNYKLYRAFMGKTGISFILYRTYSVSGYGPTFKQAPVNELDVVQNRSGKICFRDQAPSEGNFWWRYAHRLMAYTDNLV